MRELNTKAPMVTVGAFAFKSVPHPGGAAHLDLIRTIPVAPDLLSALS